MVITNEKRDMGMLLRVVAAYMAWLVMVYGYVSTLCFILHRSSRADVLRQRSVALMEDALALHREPDGILRGGGIYSFSTNPILGDEAFLGKLITK